MSSSLILLAPFPPSPCPYVSHILSNVSTPFTSPSHPFNLTVWEVGLFETNVISPFYEPEELIARIKECNSNIVIMVDKFLPKFIEALNKETGNEIIVLPMMNSSILKYLTKKYKVDGKTNETSWSTFIKDGKAREDAMVDPYEGSKPQAMVYSSGTTGASKGILLSVDSFQKLVNAYGKSGFDTSRGQKVYQNIPR